MELCTHPGCQHGRHARGLCPTHYQRLRRYGTTEPQRRGKQACLAEHCTTDVYSNGLCVAHYQRLRSTGRLDLPSVVERLVASYTVDANGCWIWTGQPGVNGYGRISIDGQVLYAHRVSWETFIGPIADELTIDHLCRVRLCVNPTHLEPVTLAENVRREMAARRTR